MCGHGGHRHPGWVMSVHRESESMGVGRPTQSERGRTTWPVTAADLLTALFNAGIAISVIATVMSLGMSFTVGQLIAPLHRVPLVLAVVLLNTVVIPAA